MAKSDSLSLPKKYKGTIENLYAEHRKLMYYIAMQVVNDTGHADDIVQSSFIRIIHNIDKVNSLSPEERKGYIIYIVKNLAIDFIRRHENSKTIPYENIDEFSVNSNEDTESTVIKNFEIDKVLECLEDLDPKYSNVVLHKYVLGYSLEEIASMLNITVDNVKTRCYRGRKKLIAMIKEGEINE